MTEKAVTEKAVTEDGFLPRIPGLEPTAPAGKWTRGTSNSNERGSSYARRARKKWLADTFGDGKGADCYSCGERLPLGPQLEADRIVPGTLGGRYVRDNIRPSCGPCNIRSGIAVREMLAKGVDAETIIQHCREGIV